ncbi:MAG: hypothetical protein O7G88_12860 [bacterium]|nr:hypothetical protein [bacterium]
MKTPAPLVAAVATFLVVAVVVSRVVDLGPEDHSEKVSDDADNEIRINDATTITSFANSHAISQDDSAKTRAGTLQEAPHSAQEQTHAWNPFDIYEQNIEAALAGDRDSQYAISLAFRYCLPAPREASEIDDAMHNGASNSTINLLTVRYQNCEAMRIRFSDFDQPYDEWMTSAQNYRQPLAMLSLAETQEERKVLIGEALRANYDDPLLRSETYRKMAEFYGLYPGYEDIIQREAWFLLYCEERRDCDATRRLALIEPYYLQNQFEAITATARHIKSRLAVGDLETLGF